MPNTNLHAVAVEVAEKLAEMGYIRSGWLPHIHQADIVKEIASLITEAYEPLVVALEQIRAMERRNFVAPIDYIRAVDDIARTALARVRGEANG